MFVAEAAARERLGEVEGQRLGQRAVVQDGRDNKVAQQGLGSGHLAGFATDLGSTVGGGGGRK